MNRMSTLKPLVLDQRNSHDITDKYQSSFRETRLQLAVPYQAQNWKLTDVNRKWPTWSPQKEESVALFEGNEQKVEFSELKGGNVYLGCLAA